MAGASPGARGRRAARGLLWLSVTERGTGKGPGSCPRGTEPSGASAMAELVVPGREPSASTLGREKAAKGEPANSAAPLAAPLRLIGWAESGGPGEAVHGQSGAGLPQHPGDWHRPPLTYGVAARAASPRPPTCRARPLASHPAPTWRPGPLQGASPAACPPPRGEPPSPSTHPPTPPPRPLAHAAAAGAPHPGRRLPLGGVQSPRGRP